MEIADFVAEYFNTPRKIINITLILKLEIKTYCQFLKGVYLVENYVTVL